MTTSTVSTRWAADGARVLICLWSGDPLDVDDDRHYVDWSVERGDQMEIWTDANVTALNNKFLMPDQERPSVET